jgi:hypothetical protein
LDSGAILIARGIAMLLVPWALGCILEDDPLFDPPAGAGTGDHPFTTTTGTATSRDAGEAEDAGSTDAEPWTSTSGVMPTDEAGTTTTATADGSTTDAADSSSSSGAAAQLCGNELREGTEECDGGDVGGETCPSIDPDFGDGMLQCETDCTFDVTACCVRTGGSCTQADQCCGALETCSQATGTCVA